MSSASRRRTQGVARYSFLIVLALVIAGGATIFWHLKSGAEADDPAPAVIAATGPIAREGAGTDELLQHARQAMADQRLLAPAGNNAFEFYLAVLKREPTNRVAQDALREIFPFAVRAAEQTVDSGNDAEAQRQIALLTRADPQNYMLTLLQTKLQAQRDAVAQQAARNLPAPKRDQTGATAASANHGPASQASGQPAALPAVSKPASAPAQAEQTAAQARVDAAPVTMSSKATSRSAVDAADTVLPVLTRRIEPVYPTEARRTRRQGWVDVAFTVQPDGSVTGATVADSDPRYVFDRAAMSAVARWQFAPGMQGGKPVSSQLRQRIEFRL